MTSPHTIRNHQLCESARALPPGRWVSRGAIKVFEPDQPTLEFTANWPAIQLCAVCDTACATGEPCDNCLTWAARDAERHSWEQRRRANRGRIWAILDARKSVAA